MDDTIFDNVCQDLNILQYYHHLHENNSLLVSQDMLIVLQVCFFIFIFFILFTFAHTFKQTVSKLQNMGSVTKTALKSTSYHVTNPDRKVLRFYHLRCARNRTQRGGEMINKTVM